MSDEQQPRPRYGEYAPGYVAGQQPAATPSDSTPPPSSPAPAPWSVGPQQSFPQQGYPQQGYASPAYQPPVKTRSTIDLVFTIILLVMGLIGTLIAAGYAALFSDPDFLDSALRQQGRSGFNGTIGAAPLILVASHLVLYLAAVGLSILSLVKKRITFWIPLSIGIVAAIIFWVTVLGVLFSDPSIRSGSGL